MTELEPSTLRILNESGQTIGSGFLISTTLAVTCAHVVASAGAGEGDSVRVQFSGQDEVLEALIEPQFWRETQKGDVAFLRLAQVPAGVLPLPLGLAEHSREGNIFRSFGYASAAEMQGIHTNGSIDGYLRQYKLLQLQSPQANHGISGAPVWDERRTVVIGMMTKAHIGLGRNEQTTFATPAELLFEVCPEITPAEICPYLGLESFSAESERFFFGRTALTEKLLSTLSHGCRFLAVFGPSGSGKSSVVQAGLLPALKKSQPWAQITVRPAENPFAQLAAAGLDLSALPTAKTVLFIDQFEELFNTPNDIRERFVYELTAALENSHLILIIAMRDDFYSVFNAKAAALAAAPDKVVVDVPVTVERADLLAIIEQPAAAVGLALEEGLTDAILKDGSSLPLLEFTLTQLWRKRRGGLLTHNVYQSIGGVTGALARWADDAYSNLPSQTDKLLAENLLPALVHLGDEALGTSTGSVYHLPDTRRRALTEFDEPTQRVITHFANRRLLITSGETVELVHDVLVREWRRLQGWLDENRQALLLHRHLGESAREWDRRGRNPGKLYRGARLLQAEEWAAGHINALSVLEQAFLQASQNVLLYERRSVIARRFFIAAAVTLVLLVPMIILAITGKINALIYRPLEMIWQPIPATDGFQISSDAGGNGHTITLNAFEMGRYEVTNRQYLQCTRAGACAIPVNRDYLDLDGKSALSPITDVSWNDAQTFCSWTGGRLPSEAEWEYAARGGLAGKAYPWGDDAPTCTAGVQNGANSNACKTTGVMKVGSFAPNGYGLYDMAGNAWEWVGDWYGEDYYATLGTKASNPQGPAEGEYKVLRGGSWDNDPYILRVSIRNRFSPDNWSKYNGFRCAHSSP